jgi:hypothetical protein
MRHRWFLVRKHKYRKSIMNKYFDNKDEPQLDEPPQARWGTKVYEMVKDMDQVEFGKKKKKEEVPATQTRKRKWDRMEEGSTMFPSFLSRRSQFSSSTCRTGKHLIHHMPSTACTLRRMFSRARSVFSWT